MDTEANDPLAATIEVVSGPADPAGFAVRLHVTNRSDTPVAVFNPDIGAPPPSANWPFSDDAYRTSLLLSFGHLALSVRDEDGRELPRETVATWATPVPRPPLELEPGKSFQITIPIGRFYRLTPGEVYLVALAYGDAEPKASTSIRVTVPPPG